MLFTEYFEAAMALVELEWLDDDQIWVGTIPGFQGVIGTGGDRESCLEDVREVLEEWTALRISLGLELPTFDGLTPLAFATA